MPSKAAGYTFDFVTYSLAVFALGFIGYETFNCGVDESLDLLAKNPLLGGDPTLHLKLPLWTYMMGHILPGVIFQFIGTIIITFCAGEWKLAVRHDLRAAITTLFALAGSGVLLAPFHKMLYEQTIGSIYFDFHKYSLVWVFSSFILAILITETWFFWIHLALHDRILYKYIHGTHHSFNPSTSACASAFHPLDIVILTVGAILVPILIPIHNGVFSGILLLNLVSTMVQHTATRTSFGFGLLNDPNLHNIHHDYGRAPKNLGSLLCIWDRLVGTYEPRVPQWVKKNK